MTKLYDLEDRLINFSVLIIKMTNTMSKSKPGSHLSGQIVRSATSTALNYGEAQAAESRRDFVHKIRIVLKELRETLVCLKIIERAELLKTGNLGDLMKECNELISIFVKSIETASKKI